MYFSPLRILLFVAASLATMACVLLYERYAVRRGIVARINSRTLHSKVVPRGGGIAFAFVFCLVIFGGWLTGRLGPISTLSLCVGGAAAGVVGFLDDIHELPAGRKFLIHGILSAWLFGVYYKLFYAPVLLANGPLMDALIVAVALFVPLWLINLYNFIDGIDGFAAAGAVFICAAALTVLEVSGNGNGGFVIPFLLLAGCMLGFLVFNLPPARIFMGDAGSIFLGYTFAALLLASVASGEMSIWSWIAILGYYVADTSTTTITRMFLVKRWYGVHRSHAYQNLARIRQSHRGVTYGVLAYNVFWCLPLAVWTATVPTLAPLAAILAVLPAVSWTVRYGPRLSSD